MPCGHCNRRFGDLSALQSHQRAKIIAIAANVIDSSLMQTVLSNIALPFIHSNASIAIETSFVQTHSSSIKSPLGIATAVNVIDPLLMQKLSSSIA